ncbi:MAG: UDP-2,3-diacylglucosamine diphosphatase [bacterium]|nr:UDP-2,3-diacylglucosamine diphosphatase [bacterium]
MRLRVDGVVDMPANAWLGGKDSRHRHSGRYLSFMFSPVLSLRSLSVDVPAGRAVYFISDVHLGYGDRAEDRAREDLLVNLMHRLVVDVAHLFIVGDLFDVWFDYKKVIPRTHVRTLSALQALRQAEIPVTYLMGNHDFGHHTYFRDELGIAIDDGDIDATIGNKRFYISHGDGKAHNDGGYLVLRSVLRSRAAQAVYRWMHPNLGISLASRTSEGSRDYTSEKDYGSVDGLKNFGIAKLGEGYDVVVMGHRHQPVFEPVKHGLYVNLGHWLGSEPTFGRYDPLRGGMGLFLTHPFAESGALIPYVSTLP